MKINLGYCCVSMLHPKLKCSRASTKTYLENMPQDQCKEYLLKKAKDNLKDLSLLLHANKEKDILAYRIPEQILPQIDLGYYSLDDVTKELEEVGQVANQLGIQLSTHPSQFFVLNSLREEVVSRTITTLGIFSDMLERMKLEKVPNMTLHVGVKQGYPTAEAALDVFCKNFERLSVSSQKFLVLENDHVSFTVDHCLSVHDKIGIPVVFDNKHYEWNVGSLSYEEGLAKAVKTWDKRIPKLHLSSDREGAKHAHSEYIDVNDYLKMEGALKKAKIEECNIMLECKQKDRAVVHLKEELKKREENS